MTPNHLTSYVDGPQVIFGPNTSNKYKHVCTLKNKRIRVITYLHDYWYENENLRPTFEFKDFASFLNPNSD